MERHHATRIAVIDDDQDFLVLITDMFADRGWEIVTCHESLDALSTVRTMQPDLIVLDLHMETPRSGWDILAFLERHPETKDIPIIVCSAAMLELRSKEKWLRDRGIGIVIKPFEIDDLYAGVDEGLRRAERVALESRMRTTA